MRLPGSSFYVCFLLVFGCAGGPRTSGEPDTGQLAPPLAKRVPRQLEAHGHTRTDDWYWLRERDNPEVIAYLEQENAYTEAATAAQQGLRRSLVAELEARIEQEHTDAPVFEGGWHYYTRWTSGAEHPLFCRKRTLDGPEQIILDAEAMAADADYFELGELETSDSQRLLAYAYDTIGRRFYTIAVKDLDSGELLPDTIPSTAGDIEWAADERTFFYVKQDPETLRQFQVFRHTLGSAAKSDVLVYAEDDETFEVGLSRTSSRDFVVMTSYSTLSDEARLIDARRVEAAPLLFAARERGLEYFVDHLGGRFYVHTNLDAPNFRIMQASPEATAKQHWVELVGHRDDVLIEDFELFDGHLVVEQRRRGLTELSIRDRSGAEQRSVAFDDPTYLAHTYANPEPGTTKLRYVYESLTTPTSIYELDMVSGERTLLDRRVVRGGFDPANYVSERLWAPTDDGVEVPISLVRHRDTAVDGSAPLLLYAYGSYGSSEDAEFSSNRLSLLDRGFVYAIAHVRGGQELGRAWYEDGKLLRKRNTFTDFIDCAEHLIAEGYADPERVFAEGGSAGGLLVGAVVNMRPELFAGAIAAVPFVDVVTTMLDEDIPLTTSEYDEWGNPNDKTYYDYMLSYSPYDNVGAHPYPALLVTAGLHDSQVQYWEPAKWVAKLRATKTGDEPLLLRTDMSAGHGGRSGRLAALEDVAFECAFLLSVAGLSE